MGPSQNSAATASVMAASGILPQSTSTPFNFTSGSRVTVMLSGAHVTVAPICSSTSANATSPCTLSDPHPRTVMVPPVIAAPARKYEALLASPSTKIDLGLVYFSSAPMTKEGVPPFISPSTSTFTPNFFMRPVVRETYGAEMSSSLIDTVTSPSATGDAMSIELKNCDDILPEMEALPDPSPLASIVTGGHPVSSTHETLAPNCCIPSMRSAMGRSRMRGTPSNTNLPFPMHKAAASGRIAVPALPKNSSKLSSGVGESIGPACPVTVTAVLSSASLSTGTLSVSSASSM
mmetsp:Transcript_34419/g.63271  ORF Transcript_34419/g.63271 Transcript_34419/m.63271 type:complete len:291 (+) Transcript_34419:478-1350(+)